MLARAEAAFKARRLDNVRSAASLWSAAAMLEETRVEALIGATRARVWLADREHDEDRRDTLAREAVESGQWCERTAPADPRCIYWLAVALGVQARERRSTALDALERIVSRLKQAIALDPDLDHGGPHRVLALVYLRAPGWPAGPGDPELGLEQARAAAAADPDYPPNLLALGEAFAAVEDRAASRAAYTAALEKAQLLANQGDPEADRWLTEARGGAGEP